MIKTQMENEEDPVMNIVEAINKWEKRLSWDEYFASIAFLTASRSSCKRLQVGCVIVCENRIVATGYNGHISGAPHISIVKHEHEQATIHAEQNAIADAARRGIKLENCVAYTTHYPCINCFKLLVQSGIKTIKYQTNYNNDVNIQELLPCSGVRLIKLS